jgi:anti-sigma B factor antagonist
MTVYLDITSRMVDDVVIVDLVGELSRRGPSINNAMKELLKQGRSSFVLNISGVSYVDSSGLGQLISIWTSLANIGGQLILLRPAPQVRAQLQMTKLDTVFTILQDEEEAVRRIQKVVSARRHSTT